MPSPRKEEGGRRLVKLGISWIVGGRGGTLWWGFLFFLLLGVGGLDGWYFGTNSWYIPGLAVYIVDVEVASLLLELGVSSYLVRSFVRSFLRLFVRSREPFFLDWVGMYKSIGKLS
jgi:hypothetical protein